MSAYACGILGAREDGDFVLVEGAGAGVTFRPPSGVIIHFDEVKQFSSEFRSFPSPTACGRAHDTRLIERRRSVGRSVSLCLFLNFCYCSEVAVDGGGAVEGRFYPFKVISFTWRLI